MTPEFFVGLAKDYRDFWDRPPGGDVVILICDPSDAEWEMLKSVGPKLRGPARWITTEKRGGWDDVDISHVVRAAYELYGDERLNIGDNPYHGYVDGKWTGKDDSGKGYGDFDKWLWSAPLFE